MASFIASLIVGLIVLAFVIKHPGVGTFLLVLIFLKSFPYIGFIVFCLCLYGIYRYFKADLTSTY